MRPDTLQSDIDTVLMRHVGLALEQDVGPLLGMLATIARELEYADIAPSLHDDAVAAALTDQPAYAAQRRVWSRIARRAARDTASTDPAPVQQERHARSHSSNAW